MIQSLQIKNLLPKRKAGQIQRWEALFLGSFLLGKFQSSEKQGLPVQRHKNLYKSDKKRQHENLQKSSLTPPLSQKHQGEHITQEFLLQTWALFAEHFPLFGHRISFKMPPQDLFMTLAARSPTAAQFWLPVTQGANCACEYLPAILNTLFQTVLLGIQR